ncbi:nucleotidyltransferase domain-containing protein [Mycolicibacterium houstonense]|uniref:nucleotidyltransferase domain-containing protein n=1 Tax=Mycolicibacterium houstonense TaxID=146021 RepID=UPI000832B87A|nr:nucleotidyltransferase domain-containing protein [Mycolicibacterium houstonense]
MPEHASYDPAIEAVVGRAVVRIRRDYPGTRAILLKGSLVRGDAGPYSDIDLDVLVSGTDESSYAAWFDGEGGRLHHVSVAVHPHDVWWDEAEEPAEWSFGFAVLEVFRLLWAEDPQEAERYGGTGLHRPAGDPELEDFFSDLGKLRNARRAGDELGVRLAARAAAQLCPSVLAVVNPGHPADPITSARAALDAAVSFPVAPQGYREDFLRCLGLSGDTSHSDDIAAAAERLVLGTVSLLEDHHAWSTDADKPRFELGLDDALANRTLSAYLNQSRR